MPTGTTSGDTRRRRARSKCRWAWTESSHATYYHAIEYAAANGYTTIDLGCDSYEAKVLRGAHLEPLWGLVLRPGWDRSTSDRLAARSRSTLDSLAA